MLVLPRSLGNLSPAKRLSIVTLVVALLVLPLTVNSLQQQQKVEQHAASACGSCTATVGPGIEIGSEVFQCTDASGNVIPSSVTTEPVGTDQLPGIAANLGADCVPGGYSPGSSGNANSGIKATPTVPVDGKICGNKLCSGTCIANQICLDKFFSFRSRPTVTPGSGCKNGSMLCGGDGKSYIICNNGNYISTTCPSTTVCKTMNLKTKTVAFCSPPSFTPPTLTK